MDYEFTPGARRALAAARGWAGRNDSDELAAAALLLGLLAEPECRAASILARYAVDAAAIVGRWTDLPASPSSEPGLVAPLRAAEERALEAAAALLYDYPRPLVLATEHLLLGLAAAEGEPVGQWLRDQGLEPDALVAEIDRIYGHEHGPLPLEPDVAPAAREPQHPQHPIGPEQPGAKPGLAATAEIATLRVLDAAANRAREGLRVVEDYVRFVLDDGHLTGQLKQLRHDLAAALAEVPIDDRLAARETQADVGTGLTTAAESDRQSDQAVLTANFSRIQEALRSLEEMGKLRSGAFAAAAKQLRYRTYTLQRAVQGTTSSLQRLDNTQLYVLVDGRPSAKEFETLARSLIAAGVHVLQLRDKQLDDRTLLDRARRLRALCNDGGALMIVNDRPDLAALAQADGVHVGQEELSVKDARAIVGPRALVGVSTHSIEQARRAVLDGADYVGVGPTFPSGTKQFAAFPGVALLQAVATEIRLPAFAIGGITPGNLPQVRAAGFRRIAVSRAVTSSPDPAATVLTLRIGLR